MKPNYSNTNSKVSIPYSNISKSSTKFALKYKTTRNQTSPSLKIQRGLKSYDPHLHIPMIQTKFSNNSNQHKKNSIKKGTLDHE